MFGRPPRLSTAQRKEIASKRKRNSDGTFAGAGATVGRHAKMAAKFHGALGMIQGGAAGAAYATHQVAKKMAWQHVGQMVGSSLGASPIPVVGIGGGALSLASAYGASQSLKTAARMGAAGALGGMAGGGLAGAAIGAASGIAGGLASHYINKKTGNTLSGKQKTAAAVGNTLGGFVGSVATTGAMVGYNKWKSRKRSK